MMSAAIQSVHFIGVGGTAMAAAAVGMHQRGFRVTGSDQNLYPPMSTFLAEHHLEVMTGFDERHLEPVPDLVVIGNAISRGNPEVEAVLAGRLRYVSLPELLREFFIRGKRSLVVAGTHGKTTTSSLLAWVFEHSGRHPSFLIGGLPLNFGQGARFTDSEWFIIEGDEYDTAFFDKRSKFVHYLPEVAIINNLEFDHADIFENLAAVQTAFSRLIRLVPCNGLLLANGDDPRLAPLLDFSYCPIARFGLGPTNQTRATQLELNAADSRFVVETAPDLHPRSPALFHLPMIGEINLRNALAVIACARHCGITDAEIQSAFDTFAGVKRRLEVSGESGGVTVMDDFGHHPTALRETLRALRLKFPKRRVWAVFEPRSNTTRRKVFQAELASALGDADGVVVAEVARSEQLPPDERLDPARLIRDLTAGGKTAVYLPTVDVIVDFLAQNTRPGDVVCVFSNGGFGQIHAKLLARLAPASPGPSP